MQPTSQNEVHPLTGDIALEDPAIVAGQGVGAKVTPEGHVEFSAAPVRERQLATHDTPAAPQINTHGWRVPSTVARNPEEARHRIHLPEFDPFLLEKAGVISGRLPEAEAQYRARRGTDPSVDPPAIPHFEKLFRLASDLAGISNPEEMPDYDELLILTAWHAVRPGVEGFPGVYPKGLLCPVSHTAPPGALESLSPRERSVFERRAPAYLRFLLREKFGLCTCADIEKADLRQLLRSTGFRLIRSSAVPEIAFPGITQGEDPPVRPWKLTLRQELTDARAAELLITAALWKIKYDLRLVTFILGIPHWNIGAFARVDWEDTFLSLGVRISRCFMRESGLLDWRAVLGRCIDLIGAGNLPDQVLGRVAALPQRISHDDNQSIWAGLDQAARTVMDRVRTTEPELFDRSGRLRYESARSFRRWARLFDEISPQILSRFGVSAFTALRRIAPEHFGWGCSQLKPWELEQEYGKWKGPRGRALLKSAYAYALYEHGLGCIYGQEGQAIWQCTLKEFSAWSVNRMSLTTPYEFLYSLASRHGLTPILNREISHTAMISLLAGVNLHQNLPRIEGCWQLCLRSALDHHGGKLEVRLDVPDLAPLPLRLRKAVLCPLAYSYMHPEIRLVRDFDLRMARETRRHLEEVPGWWEDERIEGTPLLASITDPSHPARNVLEALRPEPWLEQPSRKIRFRTLYLLLSRQAVKRPESGEPGLASEQMRVLLELAFESALEHTNIVQVSLPLIRRGFERILTRNDTREMLDSLLLHLGAAYETQVWGQVRRFIVLDVVNDLLGLVVRNSLLHLLSAE